MIDPDDRCAMCERWAGFPPPEWCSGEAHDIDAVVIPAQVALSFLAWSQEDDAPAYWEDRRIGDLVAIISDFNRRNGP